MNLFGDNIYQINVLKYKENGKYGLVNFKGEKVTKAIYEDIQSLEYKQGMLLVKRNNKFGVINLKGEKIINTEFDKIESDNFYEQETYVQNAGYIVANKINENYKYGYINNFGKKLLDLKYDEIVRLQNDSSIDDAYLVAFKNGQAGLYQNNKLIIEHEYQDIEYDNINKILILQKNQKQGIADLKGKIKLPIEYDNILIAGNCINAQKDENVTLYHPDGTSFNNTNFISMFSTENNKYTICINKDDYYGVLDENNNQLIENKYSFLNYLWDDYFIVQYNNKFGIINSEGKIVLDFKYDLLQKIENTQIIEGIINSQTNLINKNFETKLELKQANIENQNDYIKVYSLDEKQIVYLDKLGNLLDSKNVLKENKLFAKKQNGKWGFADETGKFKIEAKFDMVTDFNKYGFAGININNKWGVIDSSGNILQEPKYKLDNTKIPNFIGKYYEEYLGYGERFYKSNVE